MKGMLKRIIAWTLMLTILMGMAPEQLVQTVSVAKADDSPTISFEGFSDLPEAAAQSAALGHERRDGAWRYVIFEEEGYAVVTGYDGSAETLKVPDLFGDADTVALSAGALADVPGLRQVELPGNVMAIGKGAFPRGTTLRSVSGSFTQSWARKNSHAFTTTSELDFRSGVVDLSDIREENFVRVSATEVWLRDLEANRVQAGTKFFLADPANLYQISYYHITSVAERGDGFVTLTCETPQVDDVFNSITATNQPMRIDTSSMRLEKGVSLRSKGFGDTSSDESEDKLGKTLDLSKTFDLGNGYKMEVGGSYKESVKTSYQLGLFLGNDVTVTETQTWNFHVKFSKKAEYGYGYENQVLTADNKVETLDWGDEKDLALSRAAIMAHMKKAVHAETLNAVKNKSTLAKFTAISIYGILNVTIEPKFVLEAKGSAEVSCTRTTTTIHEYKNGEYNTRSGGTKTNPAVEIRGDVKAGFAIEIALYIACVKVVGAEVFVGLKISAVLRVEEISSTISESDEFKMNANMCDCIDVNVKLVAEASVNVGLEIEAVHFSANAWGKTWTIGEMELMDLHIHIDPQLWIMDPDEPLVWRHSDIWVKDQIHLASQCPYDYKTITFQSPGGGTFRQIDNLLYGDEVADPGYEAEFEEQYHRKLFGWHLDQTLDDPSKVKFWPIRVGNDVRWSDATKDLELYPDSEPYHTIHFIQPNGKPLTEQDQLYYFDQYTQKRENVVLDDGGTFRLAEREKLINLPNQLNDGTPILKWTERAGKKGRTIREIPVNQQYEITTTSRDDIYLCPITAKDVRVLLDAGYEIYEVYGMIGTNIELPDYQPTMVRSTFMGWKYKDAATSADPYVTEIPAEQNDGSTMEFYLVAIWEIDYTPTPHQLDLVQIGVLTNDLKSIHGTFFGADELLVEKNSSAGTVAIKGFASGVNTTNADVVIPSEITYDAGTAYERTYTVTQVLSGAFRNTPIHSIRLPATITSIPSYMFEGCTRLELIDMDLCSGITSLPYCFAMDATALRCVILPPSITSIGSSSFYGCTSITQAKLSFAIGQTAFYGCTGLTSIEMGDGVTRIGNGAFQYCTALPSLYIPDSVTTMGNSVIWGCTGLTELTIEGGSGNKSIAAGIYDIGENSALTTLTLTAGVTSIQENAFYNKGYGFKNLTTINPPATCGTIGKDAFAGCSVREMTLNMGDGSGISNGAFMNLTTLEKVTINGGTIAREAFKGLPNLTDLTIGGRVRSIWNGAFADCVNLKNVSIAEGVSYIGAGAFAGCRSIETLAFPDSVKRYGGGVIEGCTALKHLTVGYSGDSLKIDTNTTTGGFDNAYRNGIYNPFYIGPNNQLTVLEISDNVTEIGAYLFANGKTASILNLPMASGFQQVSRLVLPADLEKVGSYAFYGMTGLKELAVNNASALSAYAFNGSSIETIIVRGGSVPSYAFSDCTQLKNVIIENGVKSIGEYAFRNCTGLTSLRFPDSVTSYGRYMIYGCTNLTYLKIGGGVSKLDDIYGTSSYGPTGSDSHYYHNPFYIGSGSKLQTLELSEGITSISSKLFTNVESAYYAYESASSSSYGHMWYFPNLTTIYLPVSLTSIGSKAFLGTKITELTLNSGLASASSAFAGLTTLEKVTIKGGAIGEFAFSGCTGLKTVILEEGVTRIGEYAFKNCTGLTSLRFPDSVTSYGRYMIYGCTNLTYLKIGGGVSELADIYGTSSYGPTGSDSHYYHNPFYIGSGSKLQTLELSEGITSISSKLFTNAESAYYAYESAFSSSYGHMWYFPNLTTIYLPASLTSIGSKAFLGTKITELTLNSGLASASSAFAGLTTLEKVTIKGGAIGEFAFSGCTGLKTVILEEGVTTIGTYAFRNCTGLTSLRFPDSVTSYGRYMIYGCTNLTYLKIGGGVSELADNNGISTYGPSGRDSHYYHNPFYIGSGSKLQTLELSEGITSISANLFTNVESAYYAYESASSSSYGHMWYFPNLTTLILPASLTSIGSNAFLGTKITELTLNSGLASSYAAFAGLTTLEKVTIKGGAIGSYAFSGCTGLKTVILEEGVTRIGTYAFQNCTGLTSLRFPNSVTSYGQYMIYGCTNLTYLKIGGGVSKLDDISGSSSSYGPSGRDSHYNHNPFYIGSGSKLQTLELSEGITSISANLFTNVESAYYAWASASSSSYEHMWYFPNLTTLILPASLTSIGSNAFLGTKITELTLNSGLASASSAFAGLTTLEKVTIKGGAIGSYAFSKCTGLKTVILEEGVTRIGTYAFQNCTGLTSLRFPDSVTSYGRYMIYGCTNLTYLKIGGGVSELADDYSTSSYGPIGSDSHYYHNPFYIGSGSKLQTLELSEGITSISANLFTNVESAYYAWASASSSSYGHMWYFPNLTTIYLPDTLLTLGYGNLYGWTAKGQVRVLRMPSGITSISESGALPADLTIYSDTESQTLATFAANKGITYTVGGKEVYPQYHVTRVAMASALNSRGMRISDGTIIVTRGIEGEETTLPEGYAILSEEDVTWLDAVEAEDVPTLAGYTFLGWYTDPEMITPWDGTNGMPAANLTLYAKIAPPAKVTFAINHGAYSTDETLDEGWMSLSQDHFAYGTEITLPELPELDGAYFTGWYCDARGSIPWNNAPADKDITIYAYYEIMPRVRYAVNLATLGTADDTLPAGFTMYADLCARAGEALPVPTDPTEDGYSFVGWYLDKDFTAEVLPIRTPIRDITLYGKMEKSPAGAIYRAVNGGLELLHFTLQEDASTTVHLPAKVGGVPVIAIADRAFTHSGVQELYLPPMLETVSPEAFYDSGIQSLTISRSAAHYSTESGALYNKDGTVLVVYPMDRKAPNIRIKAGTEQIGDRAFANNGAIQSVVFPDGLRVIGADAFRNCTGIISIDLPDSVTTLRAGAFEGCRNMQTFRAYGLTTIETGADDSRITIPMSVRAEGPIMTGVLRDYFLTADSEGRTYPYNYNQHIVTLKLDDGSEDRIGCEAGALLDSSIGNVTLSDGSVILAWYTDSDYTTLWNLGSDVMPDADMTLYARKLAPFTSTVGEVTLAEGGTVTGAILDACNAAGRAVSVPETYMGQTVIALGENFLANTSGVTRISIPGTVVSIADSALNDQNGNAFTGTIVCDADSYAASWAEARGISTDILVYRLSYVTGGLPMAPAEMSKGTDIDLPTPNNGSRVFTGWYLDAGHTMAAPLDEEGFFIMPGYSLTLYAGWEGTSETVPYTYTLDESGITITGYTGSAAQIEIPAAINGWNVVAIADGAFMNHGELHSVTLPDTLERIGWCAFTGCTALSELVLPDSVTSLGAMALADMTGLKKLTIGAGLSAMDADLVSGNTRMTEVQVSANNTKYQSIDGVVYSKDGTKLILYPAGRRGSFVIPGTVLEIADQAFSGASGLTEVTVPDSVTAIGEGAFAGTGLTTLTFGGLKTVGSGAFRSCLNLREVNFSEGLEQIGSFAFLSCPSLTKVTIPASATLDPEVSIFGNASNLILYGEINSSAHVYAKKNHISFEDPNAVQAETVTLNPETLVLQRGETGRLEAAIEPANAELGKEITWYTGDSSVAVVDNEGTVHAVGGGSTVIMVMTDNGLTATAQVEVQVAVASLALEQLDGEQPRGTVLETELTILPDSATDRTIIWTSSDPSVATVDENGTVTCVNQGEAVITATAHNGLTANTPVTVFNPVEAITLSTEEKALYAVEGQNTIQIAAEILPADATAQNLIWTSSDRTILTVDETGLVTALKPGTAVVTAKAPDPLAEQATMEITVLAKDITGIELPELEPIVYDARPHVPELAIRIEGNELVLNRDYIVSGEMTHAGEHTLVITGVGAYTGTASIPQTILKAQASIEYVGLDTLWPDTLSEALSILPEFVSREITYAPIGADDAAGEAAGTPAGTGEYMLHAVIPDTDDYDGAELSKRIHYMDGDRMQTLEALTLIVGQTVTLPASAVLEYADASALRFTSSNPSIATANGTEVTAVGAGSCTLTLSAEGSTTSVTCTLTVAENMMTMALPKALTAIGEEAFAGDGAVERVVLPDGAASIGARAFADMTNLTQITIPASVTAIAEDAFSGTNVLIICPAGSAAQRFAEAKGLDYAITAE